ncbi:DUF397 domain-containing protein [Streptomyces sp. NBC_00237]|uniref:DUF397 domain-containing protein n=1 Tax=Streptomyces sp. NBC_00237 TaxID=2975687 RepID=UPI0022538B29|nr:DUF397 domain-containing protein [Streptomyces sp. NBC_00237]MCX5200266.1 DUF397 domain-containing protein [Streptomyces sp. NBC_00237]
MPTLHWQKSSFSGGAEGNCVNVATSPDGTLRLRESDDPATVLSATAGQLAALLKHLSAGDDSR